jgi:hypothetical protein
MSYDEQDAIEDEKVAEIAGQVHDELEAKYRPVLSLFIQYARMQILGGGWVPTEDWVDLIGKAERL